MKKSLLALAVLGAFATAAQAQTNVSIGGRVQVSAKSYKVSNSTRANLQNELRVDDDETSRFWLTGTEDLGGGLKALFYVENRLNTDIRTSEGANGNGLANGNTYLGLSGSFGQITAGKHTFMEDQGNAVQYGIRGGQALPNSVLGSKSILNYIDVNGNGNRAGINTSRASNSIQYITPNFSGFKGTVGFSTNPNGNEGQAGAVPAVDYSKGQAFFLAGNYTNGPIYANLAYYDHKIEGNPATGDQKQIRLSASYAFPFGLKAGFQWDRATVDGVGAGGIDTKRNAWQIPVSYQVGNHTILAQYTKAGDISGENNSGAKAWTVGYDYALSKRTNVGVFYGKLDNDANARYQLDGAGTSQNGSSLLAGEAASAFIVAVKHVF